MGRRCWVPWWEEGDDVDWSLAGVRGPIQKFPTLTEHLLCAGQSQIKFWGGLKLIQFGEPSLYIEEKYKEVQNQVQK